MCVKDVNQQFPKDAKPDTYENMLIFPSIK